MGFELRQDVLGGGAALIEAIGEIDRFEAPRLELAFADAVRAGATRVVLDLTQVDFFDSTALGVILAGSQAVAKAGGETVIVCPPTARRGLEMKGVERLIRLVDTREDALR